MPRIIRNAIRCKKCGDIIESKTVHDFKFCGCGSCAVDGGHDSLRRCGNREDWEELSEAVKVEDNGALTCFWIIRNWGDRMSLKIQLFENQRIRTAWDEEKEEWYFSIVDVVAVLTDQPDQRHAAKYWSVLKTRLKKEGSELTTNCSQLKMRSADGKRYNTDVADTEQLLRIIQSIPSPKAEPFKLWLAQVGRERIEETIDPELTIERALET